jgi:L-alanine-DL-glutamate epimerase-like enolase superfamily enzyme
VPLTCEGDPETLAERLAALPVAIEAVTCRTGRVGLEDYPGGRPSGIVGLAGRGQVGHGELVAFTQEEQERIAAAIGRCVNASAGTVAQAVTTDDPYARAAVEAALIDLGLRQAGVSLAALVGSPREVPLTWVASFAAGPAPGAVIDRLRARFGAVAFKIDVDPTWSKTDIADLPRDGSVVILDFKERGDAALVARLRRHLPTAIFEDPPVPAAAPVARDRTLVTHADVVAAAARGEAINLKAPRLGGVLAFLRALGAARRARAFAYVGGMFEVGPGREQARQLAAAFVPNAPNDLGPLAGVQPAFVGSPVRVPLDRPGFGASSDWARLL